MYIGKAARLAQVSTKTIRHYETLGLLVSVARQGKYRVFSVEDVYLIQLIKQAKKLGFKLGQMQALLAQYPDRHAWQLICRLIKEKEKYLHVEIERLIEQYDQLKQYRQTIEFNLSK